MSTTCTVCGASRPPLEALLGLRNTPLFPLFMLSRFLITLGVFQPFFQSTTFQYTSNLAPLFAVVFITFTGCCVINLRSAAVGQWLSYYWVRGNATLEPPAFRLHQRKSSAPSKLWLLDVTAFTFMNLMKCKPARSCNGFWLRVSVDTFLLANLIYWSFCSSTVFIYRHIYRVGLVQLL